MAMLDALDDGEFWLPPQFLSDGGDDPFLAAAAAAGGKKGLDPRFNHPCCGGYSGLSSPVESMFGSTETESDEEDFVIADLTRRMAGSALVGECGLKNPNFSDFAHAYSKGRCLSISPQSTLCGCRKARSPFKASSPPGGWDLLCEAAGEAAKMRLHKLQQLHELEQGTGFPGHHFYPSKIAASPVPPAKNPSSNANFYPHQSLSYQQMLLEQLKQHQRDSGVWGTQLKATQQQQRMVVHQVARDDDSIVCTGNGGGRTTPGLSASAWPSLQQSQRQHPQSGRLQHQLQNGTGMRKVFLGSQATVKRECAGTGVFLPRRAGSQPEPRKKPACPTVLVPAKVVQALNMNLSSRHAQSGFQAGHLDGHLAPETDGVWKFPVMGPCAQPRRNLRAQPVMGHEVRLPQEWTY